MCGICGIALPDKVLTTVDESELIRMRDTMVHRGPDGAGIFVDANIGLGHRRLSIVDVAHGHFVVAFADEVVHGWDVSVTSRLGESRDPRSDSRNGKRDRGMRNPA